MAELSGNTCTIKSIRPLGVTCSPTNASTPESQDGSIQLFISGGTSPYTVSWEKQGTGVSMQPHTSGWDLSLPWEENVEGVCHESDTVDQAAVRRTETDDFVLYVQSAKVN